MRKEEAKQKQGKQERREQFERSCRNLISRATGKLGA
jgi:hypothetical protein